MEKDLLKGQGYIKLASVMGDELSIANAHHFRYGRQATKLGMKEKRILRDTALSPGIEAEVVRYVFEIFCPKFLYEDWIEGEGWRFIKVDRKETCANLDYYSPVTGEWKKNNNKVKYGVKPASQQKQKNSAGLLEKHHQLTKENFAYIRSMGISLDQSRMFLPGSVMVRFLAMTDMKSLLLHIKKWDNEKVQSEMREYIQALKEIVSGDFPNISEWAFFEEQEATF
jgi:thymidylate synthase ThyX